MRFTLNKRSDYAVRMLMYMAGLEPDERATTAALAEECDVPKGNVPTIVNQLSRAGLLMCTPGRGGGCELARDPADITVLEIIQILEGNLDDDNCLLDSRRCHTKDPKCALHDSWVRGKKAAIAALADVTLESAAIRDKEIRAEFAARTS